MSNFSDHSETLVATWLFTTDSATRPTAWYLGVGTGNDDAGLTGEPSGNGYSRQQVVFTVSGAVATLSGAETFGPCTTTGWGTIASAAIFDAATGGNCLAVGALTTSRLVEVGDSLTVADGAVTFTIS
jgi:hypothetical protein